MSATKGQVLQHVIDSITPSSQASASAARAALAPVGSPMLSSLAAALAAAQHTTKLRLDRRTLVIAAGDHGCGDPGVALGPHHPTVVAAHAIADGVAAVSSLARASRLSLVLVDAGSREPTHMPALAIQLGTGPSHDLLREPALTVVDAMLGLEAGIALSLSLSEQGLDVLALGSLGVGAEVASAALVGAVTGRSAPLGERDDEAQAAMERAVALHHATGLDSLRNASGLELLAHYGGPDTALLAGLILGAASMNVPVILDGHATGAAALVATRFAPAVTGYLIAAHRGAFTMPAILDHLGLTSIFEAGLGHGDGTGAAMLLSLVDQLAALSTSGAGPGGGSSPSGGTGTTG